MEKEVQFPSPLEDLEGSNIGKRLVRKMRVGFRPLSRIWRVLTYSGVAEEQLRYMFPSPLEDLEGSNILWSC